MQSKFLKDVAMLKNNSKYQVKVNGKYLLNGVELTGFKWKKILLPNNNL